MTPLDSIAAPPAWMEEASCADIHDADAIFFPGPGASTTVARQICARCPSRIPCLTYAVERHIPFGVFGGMDERERRHLTAGDTPGIDEARVLRRMTGDTSIRCNPAERAEVIRRLEGRGMTKREIEVLTGINVSRERGRGVA